MMKVNMKQTVIPGILLMTLLGAGSAQAAVFVQCPGDTTGDAVIDTPDPNHPNAKCMHIAGSDGFTNMADGTPLYIFSFGDVTGVPETDVIDAGTLAAEWPAPTIALDEGQEFYLSMTNVGMVQRPDLFDPHTVHFHGYPNASDIFDGVPDATISINMGSTITYYYKINDPGTYMWHCHVEATEHMQMGMLGNLYVRPAQNGTTIGGHDKFVYNDTDGTTGYDVEVPIQLGSFDSTFHDASRDTQPLPFADMNDDYFMLNGRGYPDTKVAGILPDGDAQNVWGAKSGTQPVDSVVTATVGQKILLRLSNLNTTNYYTMTSMNLPMKVVGTGARHLRGTGAAGDLYYDTTSVTLGGGESVDVIVDTTGFLAGTYFLYTTNLNYLSNGAEDFGGMMTEITLN